VNVEMTEPIEILLVDDREENLVALEAVLNSTSYKLVRATSGDQALRYLLDGLPALILMDVQMPGLDGYETAAILKSSPRTREIPIIFVTALNEDEQYTLKGYSSGAVDYIYKPYDAQVLRSKVAVFADLHQKTQRLLQHEQHLRETESKERERKIAELEIKSLRREQAEQKRYRHLVEGINHGVVWSALPDSMIFSFVSPSAEKLLGYAPKVWLSEGSFWALHLPPDDHKVFLDAVTNAIKTGESAEVEHRFIKADGEIAWLQTGVRLSNNGERTELRGLSIDITKIKAAESTLANTHRRSGLLAQSSLILSSSFDCETNIREVANFLVEQICDFAAVELLDEDGYLKAIASVHKVPARIVSLTKAHTPNVDQRRVLGRGKAILTGPTELHSFASIITVPLFARGGPLGILTIAKDFPERNLDENDLRLAEDLGFRISAALDNSRLYKQAEAAIRIRDEFLSIASHELKTPLTPLKLHTQQLMRTLSSKSLTEIKPERVGKMLEASNRQIERLSHLIDDLLDISRISTGKLSLRVEEFDLKKLIDEVLARFSSQLREAECDVICSIHGSLPVRMDPYRIEQVMINLLTNAIKYGQNKPIEISALQNGDRVSVSFKDNGIGIAKDDQSRIFQRFERAVSGNHFGGLGLGLYIVSQILEAHGGKIGVESEEGQGARFSVDLPIICGVGSGNLSTGVYPN
jgi:PAS domain S-box-containing protein